MSEEILYQRHGTVDPDQLTALFTTAWGEPKPHYERVLARSFTWVTASSEGRLVGFVNVAWDGDAHFFLLDTTVHPGWRHKGIGRRLVEEAIDACRGNGEWLHVDASPELMTAFYGACGFQPTAAGLLRLTAATDGPPSGHGPV